MDEKQIRDKYPTTEFHPVLITEVTRMKGGNYCVAGWDFCSEKMVRPLQSSGANWRLGADRSIFSMGHLLNCTPSNKRSNLYPHATEDIYLSTVPIVLEQFDESTTYSLLISKTFSSIHDLFEQNLDEDKYLPVGTNCRSLGGIRAVHRNTSFVGSKFDDKPKLQLRFKDGSDKTYYLPVTCDALLSKFYDKSGNCYDDRKANNWLNTSANSEIILRIGLARGWEGPDRNWHPPRCYAQLNGIICP